MTKRYTTIEVACTTDKIIRQGIIMKTVSMAELHEAQQRLCFHCLYKDSKGSFYCQHTLLPLTVKKEDCPYYKPVSNGS